MNKKNNPFVSNQLSASATVEGALIIPIFIFSFMAIMYMIQIVAIRARVNDSLYNATRKLCKYAYAAETGIDEKELSSVNTSFSGLALLQPLFYEDLGKGYGKNNNIVGGDYGFVFLESKILDNDSKIEAKLRYTVKNPFDIIGISYCTFTEACVTDAWLGEDKDSYESSEEDGEYVFITFNGSVYHTHLMCTYLTRIISSCDLKDIDSKRNSNNGKYYPCKLCAKENNSNRVYITETGERYHTSLDCSELKRVVIRIKKSEVKDRDICEKCKLKGD